MNNRTAIILLLLAVGIFYTFTSPQYQEVKDLRTQAAEYKGVLGNAEAILGLRDALQVNYAALPKEEIERLNKVLPDNVDTVQIALDLDGIASKYGISLGSIKAATEETIDDPDLIVLPEYADAYDRASVSFSFISSYANFKNFIADVERSLRLMDIRAVSFQVSPESSLNEYEISADVYWLK